MKYGGARPVARLTLTPCVDGPSVLPRYKGGSTAVVVNHPALGPVQLDLVAAQYPVERWKGGRRIPAHPATVVGNAWVAGAGPIAAPPPVAGLIARARIKSRKPITEGGVQDTASVSTVIPAALVR